jgi:hypothetical protein
MSPAGNVTEVSADEVQLSSPSDQTNYKTPGTVPTSYSLVAVNYLDNDVEILNASTGDVESIVSVGDDPLSVIPCPGTMYAAVLREGWVTVVNPSNNEVRQKFPLLPGDAGGTGTIDRDDSGDRLFWRPDTKYLYLVTDTYLAVINCLTRMPEHSFDARGSGVAVDMSRDGSTILMLRHIKDNK